MSNHRDVPPEINADFRFIMNGMHALEELKAFDVEPDSVISLTDGFDLGSLLFPVTLGDAEHFNRRDHARADGKRLRCTSCFIENLDTTAFAGYAPNRAVALLDAGHVARMAAICDRLTPLLRQPLGGKDRQKFTRDLPLVRLLRRFVTPDWSQGDTIARGFPDPSRRGAGFGGYMVLSDLIRLIWVHEWAHVMLGHVDLNSMMGHTGLDEHSARRDGNSVGALEGMPWPHVLQFFELHADQFAVSFLTQQVLRGYDPAGAMAGAEVDLIQRLCALAAACAVFAVDSFLKEDKADPNLATHPSAGMRYMCMLQQIETVAIEYDPGLTIARTYTYRMIEDLVALSEDFYDLIQITPMLFKTPRYKEMCRVSDYLFETIGQKVDLIRQPYVYYPRR